MYQKIDIKRLNNNINEDEKIIEDEGTKLCDINLSIGIKKYYIKSFKDINSIYCENEINIIQLKTLINHKELENLKPII